MLLLSAQSLDQAEVGQNNRKCHHEHYAAAKRIFRSPIPEFHVVESYRENPVQVFGHGQRKIHTEFCFNSHLLEDVSSALVQREQHIKSEHEQFCGFVN